MIDTIASRFRGGIAALWTALLVAAGPALAVESARAGFDRLMNQWRAKHAEPYPYPLYPWEEPLRREIIKAANRLSPEPAIPEEARRSVIRATNRLRGAKNHDDYLHVAADLNRAIQLAPWWHVPYMNLSAALELDGRYDEAIDALHVYLATGPSPEKAQLAQNTIDKLITKFEAAKTYWTDGKWRMRDGKVDFYRVEPQLDKEKDNGSLLDREIWSSIRPWGEAAGGWFSSCTLESGGDRLRCRSADGTVSVLERINPAS